MPCPALRAGPLAVPYHDGQDGRLHVQLQSGVGVQAAVIIAIHGSSNKGAPGTLTDKSGDC